MRWWTFPWEGPSPCSPDGRSRAAIYDTEAGTTRILTDELVTDVLCVGAARALALSGIREGRRTLLIHDLRTDSTIAFPGFPARLLGWIPDRPAPAVRAGEVEPDTLTIRWGEKRSLTANGRRADGQLDAVNVQWHSADPGVASVSSTGEVSGNRRGVTTIVASYREWLADTVAVRVAGEIREDVLFRPDLGSDVEESWIIRAYPPPHPVLHDGQHVLSLEGDGRYSDPILSREAFGLAQGATLEFEMHLDLTRRDRQRLMACLMTLERRDTIAAVPGVSMGLQKPSACVRYPVGELAHFQPDRASLYFPYLNVTWDALIPSGVSMADWTHMALQVRPDGKTTLYVDRQPVVESEIPLRVEPGSRWRVRLDGAAVDTELLVRNLTLWRGTRYPDAPGGEDDRR